MPSLEMRHALAVLLTTTLLLGACGSSSDTTSAPVPDSSTTTASQTSSTIAPPPLADPPLTDLQTIGSHNSYHLAPGEATAAGIGLFAPDLAAGLDYSHLPLPEQLDDHGIRQLELDVFADPDGGLYADRELLSVVGQPTESGVPELDQPGYKVLHITDMDFETTCHTLVACLEEVEGWSSANPDHAPILILLEVKQEGLAETAEGFGFELPDLDVGLAEPPELTPELLEDLESEVLSVFAADNIITPDEVRGDHETLDAAVRSTGWPTLEMSAGRIIFALDNMDEVATMYRAGAAALEGRLFFTSAVLGEPDGAFIKVNDPIAGAQEIADALAAGYLVRTRADADTVEARSGDVTRRDAALDSGAHYVSTDYYLENPEFGTGYVVALPAGAVVRCNPVTADASCAISAG